MGQETYNVAIGEHATIGVVFYKVQKEDNLTRH